MIAALYVSPRGTYSARRGVDPWDESRDARKYDGPYPIIAHPPCQRWGKFWAGNPLVIARTGVRQVKGDDGGCFAAALASVIKWGGVLEHPMHSAAWAHFGLAKPPREGGWIAAGPPGLWTCCVEQGRYGHYAPKPTWLLACHVALLDLDWGVTPSSPDPAMVARYGRAKAVRLGSLGTRGGGRNSAIRIGTPEPFARLLMKIAATRCCTGGTRSHSEPSQEKTP